MPNGKIGFVDTIVVDTEEAVPVIRGHYLTLAPSRPTASDTRHDDDIGLWDPEDEAEYQAWKAKRR